jgi:ribonuclease HII
MIIIGVDEAGRGPLFGDVYTSSVILPTINFDETLLKDSKKFSSKKSIEKIYNYICDNVKYYDIDYATVQEIDKYNILQATQKSMHRSIHKVINKYIKDNPNTNIMDFKICVDGNYFNPFFYFYNDTLTQINHECIIKGDISCKSISAASILAKVSRDKYIINFITSYPEYEDKYKLSKNKGYGTKQHIEGIKNYGYSIYHRKSFKIKSLSS